MVAGEYQMKPDLPFTAGSDAAGVVIETGSRVTRLKPGDRVAVGHYIGTFADEMVAKEWTAVVMPDGVDFAEAAAMRVAHGTAYYGLARRGALKAGETLLVHGASGGVGLAAVQLGRQLGATVIGTVGDEAKAGIVRDNGAAHVLTYDGETRLRDRVKELCADGADVIFDVVGGDVFDESLRCIAWDGRLLVVGFTSGRIPSAPANLALLKHCSITGVFFGAWMGRNHADYRADAEQLLAWCASGEVRPHVSATYPLEDAVEAMAVLAERKATGKVVLTMN
jgi:NADPH2:quinone reductase